MAAGLGFKTFNSGDVLSAADVNGYLMQGVLVFASTAARDAAITAPAEGQFAFTKDTNGLWYYDGAAWVASGATGDIEGVTAGTGISGGGTSGTVTITNSMATTIDAKGDLIGGTGSDTFARLAVGANDTVLTADSTTATGLKWAAPAGGGGAMVLTKAQSFSASATINVNDCFSTTYKNYLIIINNTAIAGNFDLNFRLRVSSADNTTSNYNHWGAYFDGSSANTNLGASSADKWDIGNSIGVGFYSMFVHAPYASEITGFECTGGSTSRYKIKGGNFNATTSFTGFSLLPSSNDMTGTLRVYGLVDA